MQTVNFIMRSFERQWTIRFTIIFVCLTWIPYLFAFAMTPSGMSYMWLLGNPDDQNVHLMWARQAADGAFMFKDLYTTEEHAGNFFHLPMLLLGLLHFLTGMQLHLLYQVMRTVAVVLLCFSSYWLAKLHFNHVPSRRAFMLFLCFSSGFGWLAWMLRDGFKLNVPLFMDVSKELIMPEAITFLTALAAPMTALGTALQVSVMALLTSYAQCGGWKRILAASFLSLILGNAHSYAAMTMVIAILIWCPMRLLWEAMQRANKLNTSCDGSKDELLKSANSASPIHFVIAVLVVCVCAVVGMLPQALAFKFDVAFREKALTPTLTPPPLILFGTYGLLALLSIIGMVLGIYNRWRMLHMPLAWALGTIIAIHLPVSFQRKLIEGFHIPICMLVAYGAIEAPLKRRWIVSPNSIHAVAALLTILMFPSNGAYVGLNIYWLINNNMLAERLLQPPYYLTHNQLRLIKWIRENSSHRDSILCSPMLGNYVPPLSGRAVFIGHWAETLGFVKKLRIIMECYRWKGEQSQVAMWMALARKHNVSFVLVTDFERAIGSGKVSLPPFCNLSFRAGNDEVYRIDLTALAKQSFGSESAQVSPRR